MRASQNCNQSTVEFIGGPFDGYLQPCPSSQKRMPGDVVWLVSSNAFRQIKCVNQVAPTLGGKLTSVALYGLDTSSKPPRYRHEDSISVSCLQGLLQNLSPKQNG